MNRAFTYAGVFLVALATLMLEVLLTRIISVIAWYHLAFFVISLAMLGMTAGAVAVFLAPGLFADEVLAQRLAQSALAFSLVTPIAVGVTMSQPLLPATDLMSFLALLASGTSLAVPFALSGVALTLALTRAGLPPGIVYGVDLCGAAAGCLLVIPLLDAVDAPSAAVMTAAVAAAASGAFAVACRGRWAWSLAATVGLVALGVGNAHGSPPPLRPAWVKGEREDPETLAYVGWNTYSRVTVENTVIKPPMFWSVSFRAPPQVHSPVPWRMMEIDGAASTMLPKDGDRLDAHAYLDWDLTSFAHILRPSGPAAVIGVGGGRDVIEAMRAGHKPVVGIELNQLIIDLHEKTMADFSGLANLSHLQLVADEARSFLSRDRRQYNVITMSLIDTWASTGTGAYALSENGLYTLEAWQTFLSRLTPTGIFTVSRWYKSNSPGETARMTALAKATLWSMGISQPLNHMLLLQHHEIATLLLSPTRFSPADIYRTRKEVERLGYNLLLCPRELGTDPMITEVARTRSPREMLKWSASQTLDLTPPTDGRPFFFNMLKPSGWFQRSEAVEDLDVVHVGNLRATQTLLYAVLVSLVLTLATVIAPLLARRRDLRRIPRLDVLAATAYFALIGLGFMYVEMALLSRLNVFIGHPTLALAVLLGGIILFAGVGSLLSARVSLRRKMVARLYVLVPALLVLGTGLVTAWFLSDLMMVPTPGRIAISLTLIAPCALGLGICFPLGLRLVERVETYAMHGSELSDPHPPRRATTMGPWLWGINGAFGVCASGLALGTSMVFGVHTTLLVGALCYFLLPLATWRLARS